MKVLSHKGVTVEVADYDNVEVGEPEQVCILIRKDKKLISLCVDLDIDTARAVVSTGVDFDLWQGSD